MIKVIFFDLGEVVLTNDWHYDCPEKFKAFSDFFGIDYGDMERGWNRAWPLYELNKITENKFWQIFLETAGSKKVNIDKAMKLWRKYFTSKPEMFPLLSQLKKKYRLIVLSATGKEWLDFKIKKYHLNDFFSDYITTFNTGLKKTDKKIYFYALKKFKINPEEGLLIDDTEKVVQTASMVGLKTILFKNPGQLYNSLDKLHLLE